MTDKKCYFCGEKQEYIDGYLKGTWFEDCNSTHIWKFMPRSAIAHIDCYIENIVIETLKKIDKNK